MNRVGLGTIWCIRELGLLGKTNYSGKTSMSRSIGASLGGGIRAARR